MEDFILQHTYTGQHELERAAKELARQYKRRTGERVPVRRIKGILRKNFETWYDHPYEVVGCSI